MPPMLLQIIMYLVVGGLSSVVDVGGFWALLRLGLPIMAATVGSFVVAAAINYVMSFSLAFARGRFSPSEELFRFCVVAIISLVINTAAVWTATQLFLVPPMQAKVTAVVIVFVWNFVGRRLFVFHDYVPHRIAVAFGLADTGRAAKPDEPPAIFAVRDIADT